MTPLTQDIKIEYALVHVNRAADILKYLINGGINRQRIEELEPELRKALEILGVA